MERKTKTIFQLDTPFTEVSWPETSSENQETILELLCSLLSPIGSHRSNHVTASKGKRDRKRKRKATKSSGEHPVVLHVPPPPDISSFVVVGLNSIHRRLEMLSKSSKPKLKPDGQEGSFNLEKNEHFSAIFVLQSPQLSIFHSHLPQLVQTASLAHPAMPPTRLVQLPKGSNFRICEALGLSRVSFVGILAGAPDAEALVHLVQECIQQIEIPWLVEAKNARYKSLKVVSVETSVPLTKVEQGRA